ARALGLRRDGEVAVLDRQQGTPGAAAVVGQQVAGDAERVAPRVLLALGGEAGLEEPQEALLGQVVRQGPIPGRMDEIRPEGGSRLGVEGAERRLVHRAARHRYSGGLS